MKIKTRELSRPALNWTVAQIEKVRLTGARWGYLIATYGDRCVRTGGGGQEYAPSTNWAQGGPIIEREFLCVDRLMNGLWCGAKRTNEGEAFLFAQVGPTPLIAAMRCFVAAKLGDEVEIPDELGRE